MDQPATESAGPGRPSDYSAELADHICFQIAEGKTLTAICKAPGMPHRSTVLRWALKHEEFRDLYARAMDIRTDVWADETVDISDDSSGDYIERTRDDGSSYTTVDHDHIARSRLRVDTRKWIASKLKPRKYGDRVAHELSGPNGGPLTASVIATDDPIEAGKQYLRMVSGEDDGKA